jgi:hypothetical protein
MGLGDEVPNVYLEVAGEIDEHDADALYRDLRRVLDAQGIDAKLGREDPPPGSKSMSGLITSVVVPITSATAPFLASVVYNWVTTNGRRCTVRLQGPSGEAIEVPHVKLSDVDAIIERWKTRSGQTYNTPKTS